MHRHREGDPGSPAFRAITVFGSIGLLQEVIRLVPSKMEATSPSLHLKMLEYYHYLCSGNQPDPGDIKEKIVSQAGYKDFVVCDSPGCPSTALCKSRPRHRRETEAETVQRAAQESQQWT